jgi:phosphoribosylaminoimidazole-succinocarboxamide synthase
MLPLLTEGSVKNIHGIKGESPYTFDFSNRYSVFDWGAMPDQLENKGKALSYMAWFFFDLLEKPEVWKDWECSVDSSLLQTLEELKESGLKHHCLNLVKHDGNPTSLLEVEPVEVIQPSYDDGVWGYEDYESRPSHALVPLEFIFRFGMPQGSSLMKRVGDDEYLKELGLHTKPEYGDNFETPIIEFSTKLEPTDRYIKYSEAKKIASLSDVEFNRMLNTLKLLSLRLRDIFAEVNLKLWDGKFEFAFADKDSSGERNFVIVDSIGPDELRLTQNGISLSKENLRMFYRDSEWHMALEEAKKMASDRKEKDWKKICLVELNKSPEPLDLRYKKYAEGIYTGLVNKLSSKYHNEVIFEDSKSLEEVIEFFRGLKS